MRSKSLVISLLWILLPFCAHAVDMGTCRAKNQQQATHLFFSIEEGRKLLMDLKVFRTSHELLTQETMLSKLAKEREQWSAQQVVACEKVQVDLKKALEASKALVDTLKKERGKTLSVLAKVERERDAFKRSRVTWAMIGVGAGLVAMGALQLTLGALQTDPQQRMLWMVTGGGASAAGIGLVIAAGFR